MRNWGDMTLDRPGSPRAPVTLSNFETSSEQFAVRVTMTLTFEIDIKISSNPDDIEQAIGETRELFFLEITQYAEWEEF